MTFLKLAGTKLRRTELEESREGDVLDLVADENNQYDKFAVKVINKRTGKQVGWIPNIYSESYNKKIRYRKFEAIVKNITGKDKDILGMNVEILWQ